MLAVRAGRSGLLRLAKPTGGAPRRTLLSRYPLATGVRDAKVVADRQAEVAGEVDAAADRHGELVEYLSDAMAFASVYRADIEAAGDGDPKAALRGFALRNAAEFDAPGSEGEAWRVQQAVVRRVKERYPFMRQVGYKVGASSEEARDRLGLNEAFVGPVWANRLYPNEARFRPEAFERETLRYVEMEIGWTTLLPFYADEAYTYKAVEETLGDLWALCEVAAHRFTPDSDVSGLMTIADCGGTGHFVLSNKFQYQWSKLMRDVQLVYCDLYRDDEVVSKGIGQKVMEHPGNAASHLVHKLTLGDAADIPKHVFLATGSMNPPYASPRPGEMYRALFKRDENAMVGWLGFTFETQEEVDAAAAAAAATDPVEPSAVR